MEADEAELIQVAGRFVLPLSGFVFSSLSLGLLHKYSTEVDPSRAVEAGLPGGVGLALVALNVTLGWGSPRRLRRALAMSVSGAAGMYAAGSLGGAARKQWNPWVIEGGFEGALLNTLLWSLPALACLAWVAYEGRRARRAARDTVQDPSRTPSHHGAGL